MSKCYCARHPVPHNKEHLCEITGFNLFLGEVQRRLIEEGYDPPAWPDSTIRDQGDLDDALDVCVQWCKDRLDAVRPEALLTNAAPQVSAESKPPEARNEMRSPAVAAPSYVAALAEVPSKHIMSLVHDRHSAAVVEWAMKYAYVIKQARDLSEARNGKP